MAPLGTTTKAESPLEEAKTLLADEENEALFKCSMGWRAKTIRTRCTASKI